jgi:glycosyltransferase involved in cell wall biosynthesis
MLQRQGHEVLLPPMAQSGRDPDGIRRHHVFVTRVAGGLMRAVHPLKVFAAMRPDTVVLHQPVQAQGPDGQRSDQWPNVTRRIDARVVVDLDDTFMSVAPGRPTGAMLENQHLGRTIAAADLLTAATPFLAEQYGRFNRNVRVLPNYLDWEVWGDVVPVSEREWRKVRVGWFGVTDWRIGDLGVLRGVLGPWLERNPGVEFVAVGDSRVHDILGVPSAQRVTVSRVRFQSIQHSLPSFDIGLIPLERTKFNEAKSDLKGKEYAACGIPCIASPTESYRGWVDDNVGFLAEKARDWTRALDTLVADAGLRERMGRQARLKAEGHTIQEHWPAWARAWSDEAQELAA